MRKQKLTILRSKNSTTGLVLFGAKTRMQIRKRYLHMDAFLPCVLFPEILKWSIISTEPTVGISKRQYSHLVGHL